MNTLRELVKIVVLKEVRRARRESDTGVSLEELCDELDVISEEAVEDALSELESESRVHSREDCDEETGLRWFPGTFEQEEDRQEMEHEKEWFDLNAP